MSVNCPLCHSSSNLFCTYANRQYYLCSVCMGIFIDTNSRLNTINEKNHYLNHNNNPTDVGYQNFVSPITKAILQDFTTTSIGLDFGCGTGSAITKVITDANYCIKEYDPFFANNTNLLNQKYDYIACCEVMEHFYNPNIEFKKLKNMLLPNGKLYCMTHLYDPLVSFINWYYKNDHTHVFIYQKQTIDWIQAKIGFKKVEILDRLLVFYN